MARKVQSTMTHGGAAAVCFVAIKGVSYQMCP